MTDTSTHWPKAGASIAVFKGTQVLLVKRAKPPYFWSLPGGHIEPGEKAADAALRELAEETGVTAQLIGLNDVMDAIFHDREGSLHLHYVIASFVGRWLGGTPVASDDATKALWADIEALDQFQLTPRTDEMIRSAYDKLP